MDIDSNRWTETLRTALLLLAIPATLAVIHLLSTPEIRSGLIFDHDRFRIYTLWTSAYIHRSFSHLNGNLLGFAVVIVALWPFFYFDKTQKEFRHILMAFLAVLPPLISFSDYLVYRYLLGANNQVATRGFSGILAALFGLLFVVVVKEVHTIISDWQRTTKLRTRAHSCYSWRYRSYIGYWNPLNLGCYRIWTTVGCFQYSTA